MPFHDGGLNVPLQDVVPTADAFPADDDDSESDDDYVSSCPTGANEREQDQIVQAFAVFRRKVASYKKTTGTRFHRKGAPRKKSVWAADDQRNASETIPPGWDKQKWLSRSKWPGCGSRWHRDCGGKGKTFAVLRSKGHGKGHGKGQKGKPSGNNSWAAFSHQSVFVTHECRPCQYF
jgi:hypothetical protein